MDHLQGFFVGDRVVRIKGNWIGETATIVAIDFGGLFIVFDNKAIMGDKRYHAGTRYVEKISSADEMNID